jgi:polysaccharide export outer membrane protein
MIRTRIKAPLIAAIILSFVFISVFGAIPAIAASAKPSADVKDEAVLWYVIGPEDVLDISVWKNPDLSRSVTVRPDGRISLPLIGDVTAAGLTPGALRRSITKKLQEYQETVVVSVIVNEVNSYRIFILGEVARPGTYLMKRRTTVLQAIAIAGGFNQYASKNKMVVVRERVGSDGAEERTPVRFDDLVKTGGKGKKEQNLILRPGDTIFVP